MSSKRKRGAGDTSYHRVVTDASKTIYQPFKDAKSQIRLLKSRPGSRYAPLSFDTSIWSLEDAPAYTAISYTWGEEILERIETNGCPMLVRSNAHYSLWQVLQHWPDGYIWIDSICINQDDEDEKSAQVAMMFQIYERAATVAVCLGPHKGDSNWLFAVISALEPLFRGLVAQYKLSWEAITSGAVDEVLETTMWSNILQAVGDTEEYSRVVEAFCAIGTHPYWNRLWILQEITASRNDVYVLLGADHVSAFGLLMFLDILRLNVATRQLWQKLDGDERGVWTNMASILSRVNLDASQYDTLSNHFDFFGAMLCADPRDRLFATRGIVHWQKSGCQPILPDYSKSTWELAFMVAPLLDLHCVGQALRAFEIDYKHKDMAAGVSKLRGAASSHHDQQLAGRAPWNAGWSHSPRVYCARLVESSSGHLAAQFSATASLRYCTHDAVALWKLGEAEAFLQDAPHQSVHELYVDGELAALVCSEAKSGDVLVSVGNRLHGIMLVLRLQSGTNGLYDIVGQGILLKNYRIGPQIAERRFSRTIVCDCNLDSQPQHPVFEAVVTLNLTAEEAVVLVGQDYRGPEFGDYDAEARLARSITPVTLMPKGAATIKDERCWLNQDIESSEDGFSESDDLQADPSVEDVDSQSEPMESEDVEGRSSGEDYGRRCISYQRHRLGLQSQYAASSEEGSLDSQ